MRNLFASFSDFHIFSESHFRTAALTTLCMVAVSPSCDRPYGYSESPDASSTVETRKSTTETYLRTEYQSRTAIGAWPNMSGPDFNSTSRETGLSFRHLAPEKSLWTKPVGTGYGMPIVGDHKVFLFHRQGDEEIIDARHLSTGEVVWEKPFPTAYECPVGYSSGPYSTPSLDRNSIYALGTEAKLYCLDRETGDLNWTRDLQADYKPEKWDFPVGSSPLVSDGRIYLNLGGTTGKSTLIALDANTGKTIWTALDDGRSYTTPRLVTVHGLRHLLVLTDRYLNSLDPRNGQLRWQVEFGVKKSPNRVNSVSPVIADDRVLVTAGPGGGILCLEIQPDGSHKTLWTDRRALDSQFNNFICLNNSVFGFTSKWNRQAEFRCLSLETGEIQWAWSSILMRGSLVAADGKLFLLGEKGHFAVVAADGQKKNILLEPQAQLLEPPCYSAPVIAHGKLILRDEKQIRAWDIQDKSP